MVVEFLYKENTIGAESTMKKILQSHTRDFNFQEKHQQKTWNLFFFSFSFFFLGFLFSQGVFYTKISNNLAKSFKESRILQLTS